MKISSLTTPAQVLQVARDRARDEAQAMRADIKNLNAKQRIRLSKINTLLSPSKDLAGQTETLVRLAKSLNFVNGEEYLFFSQSLAPR